MILQYIQKLNTHRIVLASKSPRRKEILENIGLAFDVCPTRTLMLVESLLDGRPKDAYSLNVSDWHVSSTFTGIPVC